MKDFIDNSEIKYTEKYCLLIHQNKQCLIIHFTTFMNAIIFTMFNRKEIMLFKEFDVIFVNCTYIDLGGKYFKNKIFY